MVSWITIVQWPNFNSCSSNWWQALRFRHYKLKDSYWSNCLFNIKISQRDNCQGLKQRSATRIMTAVSNCQGFKTSLIAQYDSNFLQYQGPLCNRNLKPCNYYAILWEQSKLFYYLSTRIHLLLGCIGVLEHKTTNSLKLTCKAKNLVLRFWVFCKICMTWSHISGLFCKSRKIWSAAVLCI